MYKNRTNKIFPLSSTDSETTRAEVQKFSNWNMQMVDLLRRLESGLSDTVGAWNGFQQNDIRYFKYHGPSPTSSFTSSITAVEKIFLRLNALLQKLHSLEKQLREDNPQGVGRPRLDPC